MIISASRRTDIPSAYVDWFLGRLRAGHVLVRNPVAPRRVSRVSLLPQDVDGIVLWTKNPAPMLPHLDALSPFPYYFQCTVTAYGPELEPGVPAKEASVLPSLRRLSDAIGPDRVIWRYDPILLNSTYTPARHAEIFDRFARQLRGAVRRCTISFVDDYRCTARNAAALALTPIDEVTMRDMARTLSGIARGYGIAMDACAEALDLSDCGVPHARCIDANRLGLTGRKDRGQRPACACHQSVDIGAYNTCPNGCLYCYASYDATKIPRNTAAHEASSPLLVGRLQPEDVVKDRTLR